MNRKKPLLNPSVRGWTHDLLLPNQAPNELHHPTELSAPPNFINETTLELASSSYRHRGLAVYLAGAMTITSTTGLIYTAYNIYHIENLNTLGFSILMLAIFAFSIWAGIAMVLADTLKPCDEPIRFNRLRRKVYFYRYKENWLCILDLKAWGVQPVAYDWDDLRAEANSIYVPGITYVEGISVAVVKPGTNKVIDRFQFAHDIQKGETNWAMVQLFMQQGPKALPTFTRKPRDWNNEVHTFNLARRWAPKVQWPAEMDLESRTAPNPEEAP